MPSSTQTKHPVYPHVLTFTESDHRYEDNLGARYTSVSALVGKFKRPFDRDGISARCAARDGITQAEVLAGWQETADVACRYGTKTHEYAENTFSRGLSGVKHEPHTETEIRAFKCVRAQFSALIESGRFVVMGQELVVFCPLRRVAGTIDLMLREVATGRIWLIDWKTNREIARKGYNGQTMTDTFAHLQDCGFVHYSLQLSLYWQIMRTACWVPKNAEPESRIIHINHEGETEIIKPDFLQQEANYLLNMQISQAMEAVQ